MSDSPSTGTPETIRVHADHDTSKHLGDWTRARTFEVRARRGVAVIDLRSPDIGEGDILVDVDLDHAMLKLLLPVDAAIDHWDLQWTGRGKVKDWEGRNAHGGRLVRLTGHVTAGEIRIHRGGVAVLSAMFSRAYLTDVRRAHRDGTMPSVDDPTRKV